MGVITMKKLFFFILLVPLIVFAQGTNLRNIYITDGTTGNSATVNTQGRLDVTQHSHVDQGMINFVSGDLTASQDFQLIDISDLSGYPHSNTGYGHLEWVNISVDSDTNGDYTLSIGYLENVDATDGDFKEVFSITRSKQTGNSFGGFFNMAPNGPRGSNGFVATSVSSLNDIAFQTDVNLATTLSPGATATPSGNNDLVLRVTRNAGTIKVSVQAGYHSH